MSEKFVSCEDCKPSAWAICPTCGRHTCKHRTHQCHTLESTIRPVVVATYCGRLSARVRRCDGYNSQGLGAERYRRLDAEEFADAARDLGLTVHVRHVSRRSSGTDWYGRRWSMANGHYEVWVEMDQTETPFEVAKRIKDAMIERRVAVAEEIQAGVRAQDYAAKETWCRWTGVL